MCKDAAVFHVGDVVRAQRRAKGWTVRDLALRTGVSDMTISKLERGVANYRRTTLEAIAAALQTTTEQLYEGVRAPAGEGSRLPAEFVEAWAALPAKYKLVAREQLRYLTHLADEEQRLQARVRTLEAEAQKLLVRRRTRDAAAAPPALAAVARGGRRRQ